ncbi:MAG: hypothetical protein AAEJ04_05220 [Planctomycetota bacterium]
MSLSISSSDAYQRQVARIIFISLLLVSWATVAGQSPFDDPFNRIKDDPFVDIFADPPTLSPENSSSISVDRSGRISVIGPDGVPQLNLIGTFRLGILGVSENEEKESRVRLHDSNFRIEGSALENNHFRFRADLDGLRTPGVFSEAWIDRRFRNKFHFTFGRIPNAMGLEGGLPPEDRLTISNGILDWIGEGSSWALRAGGRWLDEAITLDVQTRLGGAADLRGDFFGGKGFSGRLSLEPFAPLLFGGPNAIDSKDSEFSVFVSGRLDQEIDGHFQIESPGELTVFRSQNLAMNSARWVHAGWRWPLFRWLHLENEWSRTGFFGVETAGARNDYPGEIDSWQLGIRFLLSPEENLPTRSGPDLPPGLFDAHSPFDTKDLEVLVRYEKADLGDNLSQDGLLEAGTDAGEVQVLRLGISSRPTPWFRWLLEATSTTTQHEISSFDDDGATNIRLLLELGG